ncbi:hypothetical protein PCK1_002915 [Pneumocystis canis]|nr:hypothetical protein PCK1_002915 [Pneumocystis canis]
MSFLIRKRSIIKDTLKNFKTILSPTLQNIRTLKTANIKYLTNKGYIIQYQKQKACLFSSKIDPKLKATALIDLLPKSPILSKTGMITTGTVLSIAAISNELYVVNEETIILASFIGIIWFLVNSSKQSYVNWADRYINNMQSLLNNSRQEHASIIKERINSIEAMKDVVDVTKDLFEISKETVQLEAKAFELSQIVNVQQEAKAVLESWVRYESALRQHEQAYLANTVISKVNKELRQPKIQQQILDQSIAQIEAIQCNLFTTVTHPDNTYQRLKYLLRANHVTTAIIHPSGTPNLFLQHLPALYLLGIPASQLFDIYNQTLPNDCTWQPSPSVVIQAEWKVFLGKPEYAEAYRNYFDDEFIRMNCNQQQMIQFYAQQLMAASLLSGDTYSTIYLGLSFILKSQEMTSEGRFIIFFIHKHSYYYTALTSMCLHIQQLPFLNKGIDLYGWPYGVHTLRELLSEIKEKKPSITWSVNNPKFLTEKESMIISQYISKWNAQDNNNSLKEIEETTLLLAITTSESIEFSFLSLFNASQAISIFFKNKIFSDLDIRISLQAILFRILLTYISLNMPSIKTNRFNQYPSISIETIKNNPQLASFRTEKLLGF